MQVNVPIDIADAVQQALAFAWHNASARPLPRDFADRLPFSLVEPLPGGERTDVVVDRFAVRVYTWAETPAEAIEESSAAMATLMACEGGMLGYTQCYRIVPTSQPYDAPDELHPTLSRACFTAQVYARAKTIEI